MILTALNGTRETKEQRELLMLERGHDSRKLAGTLHPVGLATVASKASMMQNMMLANM